MKHLVYAFLITCLCFASCSDDANDPVAGADLPIIALNNWTGHWDAICSPGQKLTFSITHNEKTQRFDIDADSGAPFRADLQEGDLIKIIVQDTDGNVLHSRSKNFEPSNPERPAKGLDMTPIITVCQIDRLDVEGF